MAALYEIANEILELKDCGLSPDEIADTLEAMEMDFEEKTESTIALIKQMQAESEMFKLESEKLKSESDRLKRSAEKLKEYIRGEMVRLEKDKFKAGVHSLTVRKPTQKLNIVNDNKIPKSWFNVEVVEKLDKKGLLKALKDGEQVSGVEIGYTEPSLIIK